MYLCPRYVLEVFGGVSDLNVRQTNTNTDATMTQFCVLRRRESHQLYALFMKHFIIKETLRFIDAAGFPTAVGHN